MSFFKKTNKSKPVHSELREDAAETIVSERMQHGWLDQIYTDFEKDGGFDDLPGKGKPLNVKFGDPLNGVLSNANFLPAWLILQHEVRDAIEGLLKRMNTDSAFNPDQDIAEINQKIKKYNVSVPIPILQKGHLSKGPIVEQFARWS